MFRKLFDWIDRRTGYRSFKDAMLLEHISGGARWRYVWGSCLAFVFILQVVTGILLMWSYSPGDSTAWSSVYFIQYEMDFGWLIRGLHHFGSQTMVVLLAVHMLQVVIAGAHLPPREFNWWLGLLLMGVVLGLSLTGYLLPWDQKGYFATQVATNILGSIPAIGTFLQKILVGGSNYGNHTLTHFYTLHVGILPPLLVLLLVLHLVVFRRHGITTPPVSHGEGVLNRPVAVVRDFLIGGLIVGVCLFVGVHIVTALTMGGMFWFFGISRFFIEKREVEYFWPGQAFRDLVACLFIFAIMLTLVIWGGHGNKIDAPPAVDGQEPGLYDRMAKAGRAGLGANLDAPADPETENYPARPEWYFFFLFQLLKYFPGDDILIGTLFIPNGVMLLLFLLPLFGYGNMRKFGHFFGIVVVVSLLMSVGMLTLLALADDSVKPLPLGLGGGTENAKHLHEKFEEAAVHAKRAVQLASQGIPESGARELLRKDPYTKGPKLFEMHCGVCHKFSSSPDRLDYKGWVEKEVTPTGQIKRVFKASDLSDFASQKWIRGLLENPGDPKYFGLTKLDGMKKWREKVNEARAEWLKDNAEEGKRRIAEQEEKFDLIAKWLAQQKLPRAERDKQLEIEGTKAFEHKGFGYCRSCHTAELYKESKKEKGKFDYEEDGGSDGPSFVGYGAQEWIRLMVMSPALRYERENHMPAFRPIDGPGAETLRQEFQAKFENTPIMPLSDIDRELIIRWMTRDYRVVFGGQTISGAPK
ncbi:MAG: cytochrome b N-terminal domain-containing protein [Gemmataceae bacterium]|nr:cytochrome b N-terminal domain-containing protein [Gemmataceae bacterium]